MPDRSSSEHPRAQEPPSASSAAAIVSGASGSRPLTEAQLGLWYAQRLEPDNAVYNTGQYVELTGALDVGAFRQAVDTAIAEADALAVRIEETSDGPRQTVDETRRSWLQIIDERAHADALERAQAWMRRDMATPIDFARAPLAAEVLFLITGDLALWYQRVHHVAIDGYGTAILTERICDLYASIVGDAPDTTSPFGSFAAVIDDNLEYQQSEKRHADRDFWRAELVDRPSSASLTAAVATTDHRYLTQIVDLPLNFGAALGTCASAARVQWPDALVGLVSAYVRRHIGQPDVVVGVPSMERLRTRAARVPAMVMNVLPVRVTVDEDVPVAQFLVDTARRLQQARRHGRYRSEQIRRDLGLLGGDRRLYGPLVNVLPFDRPMTLPGLTTKTHLLGTGPVDDLTISVRADSGGREVRLEIDANPRVYSNADLAAHADRLAAFLDRAVRAEILADVPTLTLAEHTHWTATVNDTGHDVERTTLTALIERTMRRSPSDVAVIAEDGTWTYAELDHRSSALAQMLAASGVRRGDVVAVVIPRSRELVLALVAILRAGAAYLPIDPDYPRDRIAVTIDLASPRLVLTVQATAMHAPETVASLTIDSTDVTSLRASDQPVRIEPAQPEDAAYVIYTSGSTGAPKGVVNEHHAIVNRLEWMRVHYGIARGDRILQKTPSTFDVSVWEFFLPLISGAALVVAPPDAHKDPAQLVSIVERHGVTTMHFVPSMLAIFLDEPHANGLTLRRVFCSGEELPAALRDRFHHVVRSELHNLYGPTEAAVDVTYWPCPPTDHSVPVPIGRPVWNTQMYVLDDRMRPVPPGVSGDLYIGGVQVAREYLGRPDLTAERFLPNPFANGRLYKTGDLARWRTDGALVFLGRSDHQVKIRGLRIELGEIETHLTADPAVAHAVVVAREDRPGDQRLVAYVVPRDTGANDVTAWRARLAERLPEYMVPSAFIMLDELPLSSNGKLDRKRLPVPAADVRPTTRALVTDTERRVAALIADVLGLGAVIGGDDDFFSLGGHSLLAARLAQRLRDAFHIDIGLGAVFAHPTPVRLARQIDEATKASSTQAFRPTDHGLQPLIEIVSAADATPALFCVHPAGGISWCYGQLARALDPPRRVYGLQARGLDPRAPLPNRLEDMAADYVEQIRRVQPAGPYHLAGWSVGGIIAQAMAVRLQDLGAKVGLVAMLDAYPSDRWRDEPDPDERAALRALLYIAGHDPETIDTADLTRASVMAWLKRSGHPLGSLSDDALTGVVRVVDCNSRLVRRHRHRRYHGAVVHVRAALDHQGQSISPDEWRPYVDVLHTHDVPSLHAHLTGAGAVDLIAPVFNRYLTGHRYADAVKHP